MIAVNLASLTPNTTSPQYDPSFTNGSRPDSTPTNSNAVVKWDFNGSDTLATVKNGWSWEASGLPIATPSGQSIKGLEFTHSAQPNPETSQHIGGPEQRFAFTPMTELYIKRRIFIPANYIHRKNLGLDTTGDISTWTIGDVVLHISSGLVGTITYINGARVWLEFAQNQSSDWSGPMRNLRDLTTVSATRFGYSDNNKFMAIWCDGYSSDGKSPSVVFEMHSDNFNGTSSIYWHIAVNGQGTGNFPDTNSEQEVPFILPTDRGHWMDVIIYLKMATNENTNNGIVRLWKRGQNDVGYAKLMEQTNVNMGPRVAATPTLATLQEGYLWGWSNSGFKAATTRLYDTQVILSAFPIDGVS